MGIGGTQGVAVTGNFLVHASLTEVLVVFQSTPHGRMLTRCLPCCR